MRFASLLLILVGCVCCGYEVPAESDQDAGSTTAVDSGPACGDCLSCCTTRDAGSDGEHSSGYYVECEYMCADAGADN